MNKYRKIFQWICKGKRNEKYEENLLGDMEENSSVSNISVLGEKRNEKFKLSKDK